jgi:pyruvate kinase
MVVNFERTKVIATVGPASNTEEKLWELIQAGADVFRLNFSHGSHEIHQEVINIVRGINKKHGTSVALLQDLQGPKIRTGEVENNGVELVQGQKLIITTEKITGNAERIYTSYKAMPRDVKVGDSILIDDGNLELTVKEVVGDEIVTEVRFGGKLKSKKGINLPNTSVSEPSLTEKDKEDLIFGLKNDLDWIALSFVRTAQDINEIKQLIADSGKKSKVVAKIEKPEALADIDAIIEACDGIMVARGDLGVEINMEDVPTWQKIIIKKCNKAGKPVIVATQMLESMITNPRPTRAEANDVANAVIDGADTVMLSAESASGMYPKEAVQSMVRIIHAVEEKMDIFNKEWPIEPNSSNFLRESLLYSACKLAKDTKAKAIVGFSRTGFTATKISSCRPQAYIYIFTDNKVILNQLNLVWGVRAFYMEPKSTTDETIDAMTEVLLKKDLVKKGDVIINTSTMPMESNFRTNMVKLTVV